MEKLDSTISLKGGEFYITQRESDAFRVTSGTVLVYIVPVDKGNAGRRSFIFEASQGEVLPSFCFRDMEYRDWRFCFVAGEEASLSVIENGSTRVLRERFAKKANVRNYAVEGYNGGLVDRYQTNIVTEDVFIRRSQRERVTTSENILKLIYSAFHEDKLGGDLEKTPNPLYNAAALLCAHSRIPIVSFEKIKEACGDSFAISDLARLSHFSYREVILTPGWQKRDSGPFLVFDEKKTPMVCLPKGSGAYVLYRDGSLTPVSEKVAGSLSAKAYMLYRPLPAKKLTWRDVAAFCRDSIRTGDMAWLLVLAVVTSLIGLLPPIISQKLYDEYISLGDKAVLFQLGCLMASFMIANVLFSIVKNLVQFRLTSRMAYDVQSAFYDRLFNLPESFFRKFESADLAQRVMGVGGVVNTIALAAVTAVIALIFAAIYLARMMAYSGRLTAAGTVMCLLYALCYYLISIRSIRCQQESVQLEGKTSSVMFQFLSGIAKIRIAGVEDRALYEYLKPYIQLRSSEYRKNILSGYGNVLSILANSVFTMILYILLMRGNQEVSLGAFVAFNTVFGSFSAYLLQLVQSIIDVKSTKPVLDRLEPVLDECPELDDAKELPGDICGGIEINNVTFSYGEDAPNVLEDLSLHIRPGEYVGVVGPSGCGKSTLMKLLLGFERPVSGKIYYDNKDIESLDKRELRKKMGVVLQDGKLISGSIFENITITAPGARLADVQAAVKAVGLEKDISEMPMGLHTVLSEDCGTISGGQQQRILIARAIISKPKILFFDEATSALDNITQSMVCDTLEQMDATRIVIAHRLSTIIKCDRILVMDGGRLVEQGSYQELMEKQGLFYQLASRQMA